jgi:acid phosphatase (class A)
MFNLAAFLASVVLVIAPAIAAPKFLSADQYNPAVILPPPPADDSAVTKSELAELHHLEDSRTPARLAQAEADGRNETITLFATFVGPGFDISKLPATARLFDDIAHEEVAVTEVAKNYFHRTRPYVVDPSLHDCDHTLNLLKGGHTSYPSGHTTVGYAMGVVLASLMPGKAQAILARSADFAESRLVCSVHFRSDTVAGQVLGTVMAEELLQNTAFKAEYDAAKTELIAAHLTQ